MQRSWYAKVLVCKGLGMQRSSFASSVTSFHLFPVLLMRYNCLHLILCSRKPLRGLCRWGHLHTCACEWYLSDECESHSGYRQAL